MGNITFIVVLSLAIQVKNININFLIQMKKEWLKIYLYQDYTSVWILKILIDTANGFQKLLFPGYMQII